MVSSRTPLHGPLGEVLFVGAIARVAIPGGREGYLSAIPVELRRIAQNRL